MGLSEKLIPLFEGSNVPDTEKDKFIGIIESFVASEIQEKEAELKESYEEKSNKLDTLTEEYGEYVKEYHETMAQKYITESLNEATENLDDYLDYCVTQYIKENEVGVTNKLKSELFDSMMEGFINLLGEHSVEFNPEKENAVAELEAKLTEAENKLEQVCHREMDLMAEMADFKRKKVISEKCSKLADTQKEKVEELAEHVPFNDKFESVLDGLVEMVTRKPVAGKSPDKLDHLYEETSTRSVSGNMGAYVNAAVAE